MIDRNQMPWDEADYERFVDAVRAKKTDEQIAAQLGRTVRAIHVRAGYLAGSKGPKKSGNAMSRLRSCLGSPSYDWRERARKSHEKHGIPYWDNAADDSLRHAWMTGLVPMNDLAATLGIDEVHIANRLIAVGLAQSRPQVADHLGCTPGGALSIQVCLDRGDATASIYTLVVTEGEQIVHVSLHADKDAAIVTRETAHSLQRPGRRWMISRGVPGGGPAVQVSAGSHP